MEAREAATAGSPVPPGGLASSGAAVAPAAQAVWARDEEIADLRADVTRSSGRAQALELALGEERLANTSLRGELLRYRHENSGAGPFASGGEDERPSDPAQRTAGEEWGTERADQLAAERSDVEQRTQLMELRIIVSSLEADADRAKAALAASQAKANMALQLTEKENAALRKRATRLAAQLKATKHAEQQMQDHAERVQIALEKLRADEESADDRVLDLKQRLEEAENARHEAEVDAHQARESLSGIREEVVELRAENAEASRERSSSEHVVAQLELQLEEKLSRWGDFTRKYQELQARYDTMAALKDGEIARLQKDLQDAKVAADKSERAAALAQRRDKRTIHQLRGRLVRGGGGPGLRVTGAASSPGQIAVSGRSAADLLVQHRSSPNETVGARSVGSASQASLGRRPKSQGLGDGAGARLPSGGASVRSESDLREVVVSDYGAPPHGVGDLHSHDGGSRAAAEAAAATVAGAVTTAIEAASAQAAADLSAARSEAKAALSAQSRLEEDVEDARAEIGRLEACLKQCRSQANEAAEAARREVAALVQSCEEHASRAAEASVATVELRQQLAAATTALALAAGAGWEDEPADSIQQGISGPAPGAGRAPGQPAAAQSVADVVRSSSRTVALLSTALRESEQSRLRAETALREKPGADSGSGEAAADAKLVQRLERDKRVLVDSARAQSKSMSKLRSRIRELEQQVALAGARGVSNCAASVVTSTGSRGSASLLWGRDESSPTAAQQRTLGITSLQQPGAGSRDDASDYGERPSDEVSDFRISELETHCAHLVDERSDLQRRCERLSQQLRTSRSEVASLHDKVNAAKSAIDRSQALAERAAATAREAGRSRDRSEGAAAASEAQAAMLRQECEALRRRVESARDTAQSSEESLMRSLAQAERDREAAEAVAKERSQDAEAARARLAAARRAPAAEQVASGSPSPPTALMDLAQLTEAGPSPPTATSRPTETPDQKLALDEALADARALGTALEAARADRDGLLAKLESSRTQAFELSKALAVARRQAKEAEEATEAASRRHERVKELSKSLTLQLRARVLQVSERDKAEHALREAAEKESARAGALEQALKTAQAGADDELGLRLRSALGRLQSARGELAASFQAALDAERSQCEMRLREAADESSRLRDRCRAHEEEQGAMRERVQLLQDQTRSLIRAAEAAGAGLDGIPESDGPSGSLEGALAAALPSPTSGHPGDGSGSGGMWRTQARRSRAQLEVAVSHARSARDEAAALRAALTAVRVEMMAALRAEVGMLAESDAASRASRRADGTSALEGPRRGSPGLGRASAERLMARPVPVPSLGQVPILGRSLAQRELWARDTGSTGAALE